MTSSLGQDRPVSAPARQKASPGLQRFYVGRSQERSEVYVVDRTARRPLAHLGYRTNTPFHWGSYTDGAVELSFAILDDATHSSPPELVCRAFCREVVARLDRAGFVLCHGDIALWLLTAFEEQPLYTPVPCPGGLAHRAAQWMRAWVGRG